MKVTIILLSFYLAMSTPLLAGEADVVDVRAVPTGGETFSFSVTIRHGDEGWDHYVDRWEVLAPDGTVLGTRVLLHPHVEEQPFTRTLSGVTIPAAISRVTIRAHDSRHAWGGEQMQVDLPGRAAP